MEPTEKEGTELVGETVLILLHELVDDEHDWAYSDIVDLDDRVPCLVMNVEVDPTTGFRRTWVLLPDGRTAYQVSMPVERFPFVRLLEEEEGG